MSNQPNIILVTIDSLRADHCGFMGYDGETTPTLDRMAAEGLVFENAFAPGPATPESMPVIFTGEYPVERSKEREATSALAARQSRIDAHMTARDTIAERLQRRGYETAAFTPNPFTSRHFGFDQGFDQFEDFMDESNRGELYQRLFDGFLDESSLSSLARVVMNFWQREEVFKPWASYYDELLEFIQDASEPYFAWVFLMDAHNPYLSSADHRSQPVWKEFHANVEFWRQSHETPFEQPLHDRLVTAYDDSIRYADAFLAQLQRDLGGEPVIAVHGDHGEAFGEHGSYGHEPYLYRENTHVPLVVSGVETEVVEDAMSLAGLPELLTAVAEEVDPAAVAEEVDPAAVAGEYAISATRQGGRNAVHTADVDCIAAETGTEAVSTNGQSEAELNRFRSAAERVLDNWELATTERTAIVNAASAISTEAEI